MIVWKEASLNDRETIFEFLDDFNPEAEEKTDNLIEAKVESVFWPELFPFRHQPFVNSLFPLNF